MVQTAQLQRAGRRSESPHKPNKGYSRSPSQHRPYYRDKHQSKSPSTERKHRQGSRGRDNQNRDRKKENYHQKGYRSKTNSMDRNHKNRNTSTHKDKGDKYSYKMNRQEKSKSPSNRTRGRTPDQVIWFRCGDPHYAKLCTKYVFYDGPSCSICNFLHKTRDHRQRSNSVERNSQNLGARKKVHIPNFKYRD